MQITPPTTDAGPELITGAPTDGIPGPDVDAITAAFAEQFSRVSQADNPFPALGGGGTDDDTLASGDEATATAQADATEQAAGPTAADGGAGAGGSEQATDGESGSAADRAGAMSISVPLPDGTTYELDVDTASRVMALAGWAQNLTPDQRQAFAAIEAQQAVAVQRQDYERFLAWQQTNAHTTPADPFAELEEAGVSPQTIAQLRAQAEQIQRLTQQQTTPPAPTSQQHAVAQQQLDTRLNSYHEGVAAWAQSRGITEQATLEHLNEVALRAGVIPMFVEQGRQYSPTGQVLRDADLRAVAEQAMNYALASDPQLHAEVLSHRPVGETTPPAGTPSSSRAHAVEAKKARAASLATAPSTASPSASGSPIHNVQQLTEAMAGAISQAMSGDA